MNATTISAAMSDLRAGRITPEEFRRIMRESREQNGEQQHEQAKARAVAADSR